MVMLTPTFGNPLGRDNLSGLLSNLVSNTIYKLKEK